MTFKSILLSSLLFTSTTYATDTHTIAHIPEASGISYCDTTQSLIVANDEGAFYELDVSGSIIKQHTLGKYDLEGVAEFRAIHEYGYANNLAQGEVGSIHECRFIETNRAMMYEGKGAASATNTEGYANDGSNFNVYPIIFPTKGSYATVGLQGKGAINFKAKAPGAISDTDTYGVKGIFSFNYFFASLALQPERLLIAYVCASE